MADGRARAEARHASPRTDSGARRQSRGRSRSRFHETTPLSRPRCSGRLLARDDEVGTSRAPYPQWRLRHRRDDGDARRARPLASAGSAGARVCLRSPTLNRSRRRCSERRTCARGMCTTNANVAGVASTARRVPERLWRRTTPDDRGQRRTKAPSLSRWSDQAQAACRGYSRCYGKGATPRCESR